MHGASAGTSFIGCHADLRGPPPRRASVQDSLSNFSILSPGCATVCMTTACTGKRSPHQRTSELVTWLHDGDRLPPRWRRDSEEGSTAMNSSSPQRPRKFAGSRLWRSVLAVVRRKGAMECGPCLERNSSRPSTRIRRRPKPRRDSSIPPWIRPAARGSDAGRECLSACRGNHRKPARRPELRLFGWRARKER